MQVVHHSRGRRVCYLENPKTDEEYKLLNLENDNLAPRKGIIELKPIKVEKRHENNVGFKLYGIKVRVPYRYSVRFDL